MTTPENLEPSSSAEQTGVPTPTETHSADEGRRRFLLIFLLFLLMLCCVAGYFIVRYITQPQPLPLMVPLANQAPSPPVYKLNFLNVDAPVGVAISPDGQRIYVVESSGDRLIKMFDRDGKLLRSFAPPLTTKSSRQPKYIAVDKSGRVYVVDRTANAIHIFSPDGDYIDSIVRYDATISKLVAQKLNGSIPDGTRFYIDGVNQRIYYVLSGQTEQWIALPDATHSWAPLGIRFDTQGNLIYTDISPDQMSVNIIPAAALSGDLTKYAPDVKGFGQPGQDPGQLNFPQSAVMDSQGNYYVTDGDNYRIERWNSAFKYSTFFGFGSSDGGLNMPRGAWMDAKDRLYVADAVGSYIRVYDVSGPEAKFLFNFGSLGKTEGFFSYPIDICIDATGRLYIADRENNRVSVWTY